jgi:glutamate-1-semialdehyde 2,1-aminomutase
VATLNEITSSTYLEHTERLATRFRNGLTETSRRHGFGLRQTGPAQMPLILFEDDPDYRIGYGWAAEMVRRGIYVHPWHNMFFCSAMTDADMDQALDVADQAFAALHKGRTRLEPHHGLLAMLEARH